jgi:hypothetical protein
LNEAAHRLRAKVAKVFCFFFSKKKYLFSLFFFEKTTQKTFVCWGFPNWRAPGFCHNLQLDRRRGRPA